MSEEEERLNNLGNEFIDKFISWLESKEIDDKILESSKECNFSFNMISILMKIMSCYSETVKMREEIEIDFE